MLLEQLKKISRTYQLKCRLLPKKYRQQNFATMKTLLWQVLRLKRIKLFLLQVQK